MSMTPMRFRKAIENLDDADLAQIITALGRCRTTAMDQTVRARIPECASFGGIAQDLDASLSRIEDASPETEGCPSRSALLANIARDKGYGVITDVPMPSIAPADVLGLPIIPGKGA